MPPPPPKKLLMLPGGGAEVACVVCVWEEWGERGSGGRSRSPMTKNPGRQARFVKDLIHSHSIDLVEGNLFWCCRNDVMFVRVVTLCHIG